MRAGRSGELVRAWFEPGVVATPSSKEHRPVGLDLRRPPRERSHRVLDLGDLTVGIERQAVAGQRAEPEGIGAGGELSSGVDDRVHLHRHARVDVRPLAVLAEDFDVEPQVPMDVRVARPRPVVPQLDDLDAVERFPDAAAGTASRVQLGLPGSR